MIPAGKRRRRKENRKRRKAEREAAFRALAGVPDSLMPDRWEFRRFRFARPIMIPPRSMLALRGDADFGRLR